ncbi:MAG: ABC transporter substrate-binding protein [Spirochaetaceae bacterium]|jgi:peptide/nickel transport system substrate-binding protein|nr:ABC transporter substrate-binding protein [Spirochaetaceae bacterium]
MKKAISILGIVLLAFALIMSACSKASTSAASTAAPAASSASAGSEMIAGANVPRNQTIILENPGQNTNPPDYFNRWSGWDDTYQGGLQQLALDTLWYIDPDAGVKGVWENALASEDPIYNADFTEMTVKLRSGIYWSDGVQFTADDLIYTVEAQMANDNMAYTAPFRVSVKKVTKVNDFEVHFALNKADSRFHTNFIVRWGACFIMPKHIFEKQADITTYKFNPPVSLGPYTLHSHDPNGNWYLWQKRDDWQRTTLALLGSLEQAPKYAMYIRGGTSDQKVMNQTRHNFDVIHDIAVEGAIQLRKQNPTTATWFPNFPWGHPDPTQVAVVINNERPGLNSKDVRWALTLALDMTRLAMASYRGAITISPIHVPPTGMYPQYYHQPMESYLENYEIDLGDGSKVKPYDKDMALKIATEARKMHGDMVPTDPDKIKEYVGLGWWGQNLDAAEKLMIKGGMVRGADKKWQFKDGKPFKITLLGQGDHEPSQNRLAAMVVELWQEFGIDATLLISNDFGAYTRPGDFDAYLQWNIETWGGHPDLSYFLQYFHSNQYVPIGQEQSGRNSGRWKSPETDKIIDAMLTTDMNDLEAGVDFGTRWLKVALDDMFEIPLCSFNVFTCMDTYYWTGYPSIDDPYTDPVPNWTNSRYMYLRLKPTGK